MGRCHYTNRAYSLAMPCLEGSIKIRKYRISESMPSKKTIDVYGEEVALAECFFALGNLHMQLKDQAQAMRFYIQARDIRWRHLGSGTVDSIVGRYLSGMHIDEDELMGLGKLLLNEYHILLFVSFVSSFSSSSLNVQFLKRIACIT